MASGSSGHGSSARGGGPSAAAAPSLGTAFHGARRLSNMPAVDLMSHLIHRNRRHSDFVDVALELTTRERRFAGAVARARAAEEAAARLRAEMELTRRLAAAAEERLQAEIRAWQRRAAEAEAHLQAAYDAGSRGISREHVHAPPSWWSSSTWPAGSALTNEEEEAAQPEEEEAPMQVASGKRKEKAVASSPPSKLSKKLKVRAWGGGSCSNAVPESEADTTEEAEDAPKETETKKGVGEHDQQPDQGKIGGETERFEHDQPAKNLVALADVVVPGNDLAPNDDGGVEASRGAVPDEPESLRNKGVIYKMVFKALKEKERKATLARASQPNLRFWLHAPPPREPTAVEEGPDDDAGKGAPQQ